MEKSKDKYACFQWIRDVRAEMNRDMENMTWEERFDYLNARYEKAKASRPQYTLEESRQFLKEYLAEPKKSEKKSAAETSRKSAPRRKAAKPRQHVGSRRVRKTLTSE